MSDNYYLTTPLYYINGEPHLGTAYTTILADTICRYQKLFKGADNVRFLTGVDEHGQKIFESTRDTGMDPKLYCDKLAQNFVETWRSLNIDFDIFFRTTHPDHIQFVQKVLQRLYDRKDIYIGEYSGWYCTPCERFWTNKDLKDGNCPLCDRPVNELIEKNYFFRMSRYQQWLIDHIASNPDFIQPHSRKNEILGFLRNPLSDLCISRPRERLSWGVTIPFDEKYVTYVWFDALLNYLSVTRTHPKFGKEWWPADMHLIGKDIVTTHAVYWPIMLKAAGYEPPRSIFAHGFWLTDTGKMSKSQGSVVKPLDLVDVYGVDAFRFTLMREMVPSQDALFSEEVIVKRLNSDLANDLGNLFSRLAKLFNQFHDSPVDPVQDLGKTFEPDLKKRVASLRETVKSEIEKIQPQRAIEEIMQVVRGLNKHVERWEPWKRWKTDPDQTTLAMTEALQSLELVAELLEPVMPTKMSQLRQWIRDDTGSLKPQVGKPLFPRVKPPKSSTSPDKINKISLAEVSFEEFGKIDLRIGVVLSARKVEGSDKLLTLQVDTGAEERQIVAGIAEQFTPEEMIGKHIVAVVNLKPVRLRGELSQGMLLAAGDGEDLTLLCTEHKVTPGTKVR